jgi:hypothetical protein
LFRAAIVLAIVAIASGCTSEAGDPVIKTDQLVPVSEPSLPSGTSLPTQLPTSDTSNPATVAVSASADSGDVSASVNSSPVNSSPVSQDIASAGAANPANASFPLRVDAASRALIDSDGRPFLMLGEAAWSLIVQLDRAEVDMYLENRRQLGFNTVLVELIEHRFSDNPPMNRDGVAPFTTPGDFSTPNDAYFEHADWVLERLAHYGFLVLLTPAYAGWEGGEDGWWQDMVANGVANMKEYGRFVGARYQRFDNIMWVEGGDFDPSDPDLVDAVAEGIAETDPDALHTAHLAPDTSPREFWSGSNWLDVDNVYTYNPVYDSALAAYEAGSMPYFLIESSYENEHDASTRQLRTQALHALLTGATGHIFGNNPIWNFGSGGLFDAPVSWQDALNGPGSLSMSAIARVMTSIEWWRLRPDSEAGFLTDGIEGGQERAVASVADDDSWGIVYVPTDRTITLDLTRLHANQVRLDWYDASTGEVRWTTTVASSRSTMIQTPGDNAAGDGDWVLIAQGA